MSIGVESALAIVFLVALSLFLFLKRKNLKVQRILFPFVYAVMYRTKLGLSAMDKTAKKGGKFLKWTGYIGIGVGFVGMIALAFMLIQNVFQLFFVPGAVQGAAPVLPFKAKGVFYVPFFYWIISIFIIAVIHEFWHGVIARVHGMKVKSSGFAFFCLLIPIIPAAFVEPDEKTLQKRPAKQQLSVFAAGPFSNIVLGFLALGIFMLCASTFASSAYQFEGVEIVDFIHSDNTTYPAEIAGISKGEVITAINNKTVQTVDNISSALDGTSPGEIVFMQTDKSNYSFTLAANPHNNSLSYMGVYLQQKAGVNPAFEKKYGSFFAGLILWFMGRPGMPGLFYWIYVLSLGIGLFNLIPIGPIDGGRMLGITLQKFLKREKAMRIWKHVSGFFLVVLLFIVIYGFFR